MTQVSVEFVGKTSAFEADVKRAADTLKRESGAMANALKALDADIGRGATQAAQLGTAIKNLSGAQIQAKMQLAELRKEYKSGTIDLEQFKVKQLEVRTALSLVGAQYGRAVAEVRRLNAATDQVGKGVGQTRAGFQQLGFQVGDFATQVSSGTSVTQAFAQQIGQTFQAVQLMSGGTSKFATFIGGPWGIALSVGATALAGLIGYMMKADDAAKKAKDAHLDLSNAIDRQKASQEALTKAIDEYNDQQAKSTDSTRLYTIQAKAAAEADIKRAVAKRQLLAAELEELQARLGSGPRGPNDLTFASELGEAARVQEKIKANETEISRLQLEINNRALDLGDYAAKALDPLEKIRQKYADINRVIQQGSTAGKFQGVPVEAVKVEVARRQRVEEESARAAQKQSRTTATPTTATPTVDFIRPVTGGAIGDNLGAGRNHQGVDIRVPVGTPVKAPASGVVRVETGHVAGYGNVIYIDHGAGTISRLAHLSQIGVKPGDLVEQGQVIGKTGGARGAPGAGNSSGPHLHYEVRLGGKAVDPLKGKFPADALGSASKAEDARERIAREAERKREEALRREQAFQDASINLDAQILEIRRSSITDAGQAAQFAKLQVQIEAEKFVQDLDQKVALNQINAADRDILVAKNSQVVVLKQQAIDTAEARRKADEGFKIERAANDNEVALLQLREGLTTTSKERSVIQLRILEIEKTEERRALEKQVTDERISEADREIARLRMKQLDTEYSLRKQSIERSNEGPLDAYYRDINRSAAETSEAIDQIKVDGLRNLTDGLTDAIVNFRSLRDVAQSVVRGILTDLTRLTIEQYITKPLARLLGAGGDADPFAATKTLAESNLTALTVDAAQLTAAGGALTAAGGTLTTAGGSLTSSATMWTATAAQIQAAAASLAAANASGGGGNSIGGILAGIGGGISAGTVSSLTPDVISTIAANPGIFAKGGFVSGPGDSTSDSIPARLSNGEFVLRADAVKRLGVARLDAMNQGRKFATGGIVGSETGFAPSIAVGIVASNGSVGGLIAANPFAAGGKLDGFASGGLPGGERLGNGMIRGPGTGMSDSILALVDGTKPILVSNDEAIVNARAVKQHWPLIDAMNHGRLPAFAKGGAVGQMPRMAFPAMARNDNGRALPPVTINVNSKMSEREARETGAQAYRAFRREHASMMRVSG